MNTLPLLFLLLFLVSTFTLSYGQLDMPKGQTVSVNLFQQNNGFYQSETLAIPLKNIKPFLAYALTWKNSSSIAQIPLSIRFSENGRIWKDWEIVEEGAHTNKELEVTVGELMFADKNSQFFQIKLEQTNPLEQIHIRFYHPSQTTIGTTTTTEETSALSSTCPCPLPDVQTREMWCATGTCPPHPNPEESIPTHLIIHHSAGTNMANDWAAIVRAIWDFHVNTNNWSDIGYNYLVDPNGIVYEGRGNNVLGAHFCGTNGKTMGTCVMGDFTNISPTEEAKMGLIRLFSWKACDRNINPFDTLFHTSSGLQLPRIAGHRDGCATQCPGNSFYPLLPEIRQGIADFIENDCEFLDTPIEAFFNTETVQIFPNPTSERVYIQLKNDWTGLLKLEMNSIDGKQMEQQIINKIATDVQVNFNLKNYPSGVYLLNIKTEEGQKSWKVLKE